MPLPTYANDLYMLSLNPDYKPKDPDHPLVRQYLENRGSNVRVARGEAIFDGVDYPREWTGFIGQPEAKERLIVAVASAKARSTRLDHTLLSASHGVGKSTLATLIASKMDVGFVQTSGPIPLDKARKILAAMKDRDIWFMDEIHTMVAGGKAKAEWLLPFMVESKLYTESGAVDVPDVTIIGATTDAGMLPQTIIGRFMIKPTLTSYTDTEAAQIAANLALRMSVTLTGAELAPIARAASGNPRDMRSILTAVRDLQYAFPDAPVDLEMAFRWAGFSADGLTKVAQEMLLVLSQQANYTCSIDSLGAMLNEAGPLRHHEQMLLQRGFITITGRGRQLTDSGLARVRQLARSTQ